MPNRLFYAAGLLAALLALGSPAAATAQHCDAIEADFQRSSIKSSSDAETTYRNTTISVKNTGETTWTRKDNLRLVFGYGTRRSNLDDDFQWEIALDRDVKPNATHQFKFDFRTPIDTRRYNLFGALLCGREGKSIETFTSRVNVSASYTVAGVVPRKNTLLPRSKTGVTFGFKNTGGNTIPEGGAWALRATVVSSPGASSSEEAVFEFTETLDPKGNGLAPGQVLTVDREIEEVPEADGRWRLRLELLQGGQRFKARGNPAYYDFTIDDPTLVAYFDLVSVPDKMEAGEDGTIKLHVVNTGNGTLERGDWEIAVEAEPPRESEWNEWADEMAGPFDLVPGDEDDVSFDFEIPKAESGDAHAYGIWSFTVKLALGSKILDTQHFDVEVVRE
ncbi:MAG: hypothetical protein R3247_08880 [Rhodothermales bacterium]|nr:hypothetical protein [Rhodothermales bacterium]